MGLLGPDDGDRGRRRGRFSDARSCVLLRCCAGIGLRSAAAEPCRGNATSHSRARSAAHGRNPAQSDSTHGTADRCSSIARMASCASERRRSMRQHDRNLNSGRGVRNTSNDTSSPWRRTRRSTLEGPSRNSRSTTSLRKAGRRGLRSRISPRRASNSRPRAASSNVNGVALAQACGAQATGYSVGPRCFSAPEAAEQFRKPPQIHIGGGVEQALEHLLDRMLQAVAREPERDQRVVVRPDRTVVIGHRIVARFAARHGADAPAGEKMRPHQIGGDHAGAIFAHDAAEQQLPGIRRAHLARLLGAIERQRVGAEFLAPERLLQNARRAAAPRPPA